MLINLFGNSYRQALPKMAVSEGRITRFGVNRASSQKISTSLMKKYII
jgi:hypothetical protein